MKEVKIAKIESNDSWPGRSALPKGNSSEQTKEFSQPIYRDTQRSQNVRITATSENMLCSSV